MKNSVVKINIEVFEYKVIKTCSVRIKLET